MRVFDRIHHLQHQCEPLLDTGMVLATPLRDGDAVHVFEREIRPAGGRKSRVVERGDVRVIEARQDVAFAREAFAHRAREKMYVRQLERHLALDLAVRTLREPDHAHAARADFADEPLRIHDALRELEALEPRLGKVVEMRYFGGLSDQEIAEILDVNVRTVGRDWDKARLLLREMLGP